MASSAETIQFLSQCFLNTLSPDPEPRRRAEASLAEATGQPNYGLAVLTLIAEPTLPIDEQIRQAAAVNFKNYLKARWAPAAARRSEPNVPVPNPIPDEEKKRIKDHIVPLMLSATATPRIQAQLSEALVVIGKHDFPRQWTELLPMLNSMLQKALTSGGGNYAAINGILGTANSLFKKFRHGYGTNDLRLDLRYCLDNFAVPLLQLFSQTATLIDSSVSSGAVGANLKPLFESQRLCCRIFYSFNFQELPDLFEDNMEPFMHVFGKYLTTTYPAIEQGGGDGLSLVDNLRAAICEILTLYVERTEEPFERYVGEFEKAVRNLLVTVSPSPGRDHLAITAIKFLSMVSTMAHHYKLFADDASLEQICRSIVIPNVMLREEDEELFEFNYIEFIRRDMEGSDIDTKRRAACELLKGIATHYREKVAPMVNTVIQNMLTTCAENPAGNWKYKDSAIYLVISLCTVKAGGPNVLTGFFDLQSFFTLVVVPELQSQDINSYPLLKAGALKFITVFRDQLPKSSVMPLIPQVIRFLAAESNVVHSYAAIFIEKLFLVKDEGGRARYVASDVAPFLPALLTNLFNVLKFPESEENQYIMKCIMRVLGVAEVPSDVAAGCMSSIAAVLTEVLKHGWTNLVSTIDQIQPGLFLTLLEKFWMPNLKQITGPTETKLTAVASTRLICECPSLLDPAAVRHWGKMLDSILTLVIRPEEDRVEEEPEVPDFAETGSYSATFIRLYNVNKREEDPLKEIKDPKQFLLASLGNLPDFSSGKYGPVISENVDPANQAALSELYQKTRLV